MNTYQPKILQTGRWSKEEHKRYVEALKIYGKN